jgi:hypothetical protein
VNPPRPPRDRPDLGPIDPVIGPIDPVIGPIDPVIGPRPPFPPRPVPWTPFGPGDTGTPDTAAIARRARGIRATLEKVQVDLTGRRHGRGPDGTPPVVRELTRSEGLWPWLLVRQETGDLGERPLPVSAIAAINRRERNSPDILLTPANALGAQDEIGRDSADAFRTHLAAELFTNHAYDLWVHVWNLGLGTATAVRIRAWIGVGGRFVGGRTVDLAARDRPGCHRLVKVATLTPTFPPDDAFPLVTVAAECITDPATGAMDPGLDRHVAHRGIYISPG